ncbi:MAG: ribosome silencing factor [Gemmatimonadetes bacterium]|nr:ribosome silencing factor [Gemmatimonadota bacterium]MYG85254.1 ribosome silencing factor [Gemmatimonadota bacterium]MYJ88921.1 ribosome silencing factor [Gemmatimonadota bacterium]
MTLASKEIAEQATLSMLAKNAADVMIIDLRGLSSITDYFVIGTAGSEPQIKAVVEQVASDLKERETIPWHSEGKQSWRWVLLDYVDVVVHVFRAEVRAFYGLERLWGDAPRIAVTTDAATGEIIRTSDAGVPEIGVDALEHEA